MDTLLKSADPRSELDFQPPSSLEDTFAEALKRGFFSGASLLLATPHRVLFEQTWGYCRSGGTPVDARTYFDLASLTKALITAPLYMWSIARREFGLDDPLSRFFPLRFLPANKRSITIRQLLNHCSGFPSYKPFYKELIAIPSSQKRERLLTWILDEPLSSPPGKEACYSDLGFMLLGIILELTWHKPLDEIARQVLLSDTSPLGVLAPRCEIGTVPKSSLFPAVQSEPELGFLRLNVPHDPVRPAVRLARGSQALRFAATEVCPWRKRLLEGEVHDENAYSLEGVAPHAGLFGTARGMLWLITSLWKISGGIEEDTLCSSRLLETFWRRQNLASGSTWALGFDTPSTVNSSAGAYLSRRSVGHLGFTGTSFWIDLDREVVVILLTNRVYPTRDNEAMREFRPLVHNLLLEAYDAFSRH